MRTVYALTAVVVAHLLIGYVIKLQEEKEQENKPKALKIDEIVFIE